MTVHCGNKRRDQQVSWNRLLEVSRDNKKRHVDSYEIKLPYRKVFSPVALLASIKTFLFVAKMADW